jgi:hypothetical protein
MIKNMGKIKSALEIALERTEAVKSDKGSIRLFEAKQQGKKLANEFLSDGKSMEEPIKKAPKEEQDGLRQGAFEILVSQISLPSQPEDVKRLEAVGKGLALVINDSRFSILYQQFSGAVSQYMEEAAQFEEALKRQYAPKLRQKEEELGRRLGRAVKIDPFQDPEFIGFYNQNLNALKANYEALVGQVREQAELLFTQAEN